MWPGPADRNLSAYRAALHTALFCKLRSLVVTRRRATYIAKVMAMLRTGALKLCLVLVLVAIASGCGGGTRTPGEERVGDLSDHSYFKARGKARISASGEQVRLEQFEGRFVWAEYSAPWCAPCRQQAAAIRDVETSSADDVVFLTIMTSEMGGYGHPATRTTAQNWASQHNLDPRRVVAADLTAITIPRHILYSPQGQMLYITTGFMSAAEIREVIEERAADWNAWSQSGQLASWMRAD